MRRHAEMEASQKGYRVSIVEGGRVVASCHIDCNVAEMNKHPKQASEKAYRAAKQYAAQYGCE